MRVWHLRGGELRVCDVPSGQVTQLGIGVEEYAADRTGRVVVWLAAGVLHRREADGSVSKLATSGEVRSAKPDPTGRRIAYLCADTIRVVREDGSDELLAGEEAVRWGALDSSGTYFGRDTGWWWSPDGETILASRVHHDQVSLHLLDLDGGWVDVHWDREIYPYLGIVAWADGSPLITVLRRSQSHGLILAVDRRTGETQVHAELADPRWVNPIPGTPKHLADGRVLVGGEIAHDGYDARCLFADGTLLTPPTLYVRRVVGRLGPRAAGGELGDLLIEASEAEPAEQHLYRVRGASSGAMVVHRLTTAPGWHTAVCAGDTVVTGFRSWSHDTTQWVVLHAGSEVAEITGHVPGPNALPTVDRVTDRKLPSAVLYPPGHVFGRRVPVLLMLASDPTQQQVRADNQCFAFARHWTAAGYAVVLIDGRGTLGVSPGFEKVTHRRLADIALADQIDGLRAAADKHPDLDLRRVAATGEGYGGWLALALASRRPDAVQAAVAVAPWDWAEIPVPVAERYLGPRESESEVYARHELGPVPETTITMSKVDNKAAQAFLRAAI
jgi:dipeptidyl-peptidase-4